MENLTAWLRCGIVTDNYEQNMVEQESIRNLSEEELSLLDRENLAMKIMVLRDKQLDGEITLKESLKQSVILIEEYDKNKIENYGKKKYTTENFMTGGIVA